MNRLPQILYIWLVASLAIPNVLLCFTEQMTPAMALANVLLPMGVIGLLCAISPRISRTVWVMVPLMVLAVFQIVLLSLYRRSIIAVDMFLNLVTTNSAEAGELLGSIINVVIGVCAIYLPIFVMAIITHRKEDSLSATFLSFTRRASALTASIGTMALFSCYCAPEAYAVRHDLYPLNVTYNCYLAADRTYRIKHYNTTAENYRYDARTTHPDTMHEVCVLVIGETSRADHWQLLGYGRPTTPRLQKRLENRENILAARSAYSESNTTHKAVPMLLSPLNSNNFGEEIYSTRSLITAFNEAGWHTSFISAQAPNHSFIEFFGNEAATTVYTDKGDDALLAELDSLLRDPHGKQLIVLHTYGSHFNYRDRFDASDEKFLPDDYTKAVPAERPRLINAYDNTIVATDRLLDAVISRLEEENCVASMLYSSDHGEDLYDDGERFLHASPVPSDHQVHVAMAAWLSPQYCKAFPQPATLLARNFHKLISTSRSYCSTAFGICGINTRRTRNADRTASLTSAEYAPRTPQYLDDHNHPVLLSQIIK